MYMSIVLSVLGIVLLASTLPRNHAPRPWRELAWNGAKVGLCMAGMGVLLLGMLMSLLTRISIIERVFTGVLMSAPVVVVFVLLGTLAGTIFWVIDRGIRGALKML